MFRVAAKGAGVILRCYSVEDDDGFIAGNYHQYVKWDERPLPFISPVSLSKVEARRLVDRLNGALEEDYDETRVNGVLWALQA